MALKDTHQSITIAPQDGAGFVVSEIKYQFEVDGVTRKKSDTGSDLVETDTYGFTVFADVAAWFGTLDI